MNPVKLTDEVRIIPTYPPKKPNDLPMFFENRPYQGASGKIYPLPYSDGITDEKKDVEYRVLSIENNYVKAEVLPSIGGKLLTGYDKTNSYHFIYHNEVIKPALVGLAGAWISGGIEFNWPQHHRPTTFMPLQCEIQKSDDGSVTVWMGETEPLNRMKGEVGITVEPGRSYIKAKVRLYNRTSKPLPLMWWANLAAPANKDYRTVFPPDVEWVNDHDRRAVLSWPIAKGVYKTARPYDFGEGKDISYFSEVKVPSSYLISQGQSDMDFVGGYDEGKKLGLIAISDHYIAPGKKMWHWGDGDFGRMWCSNLTDNNGPYIELMTGVYTDNQPDFTWIAPYESREFEQYWYPVSKIGCAVNANKDAAINLERRGERIFIGVNPTMEIKKAKIILKSNGKNVFTTVTDISPVNVFYRDIGFKGDFNSLNISVYNAQGKEIISYSPYLRGKKDPIEVRKPVQRPSDIKTVEELYINGYHLEQYKQHNYRPEDYYFEGLKRDPDDIRCNTSMARLNFAVGNYRKAAKYADRAIGRLTSRNQHPTDTEAFYIKACCLEALENYKEAYDYFAMAGWNYQHRSAAYYHMGLLDMRDNRYEKAKSEFEISLGLNSGHLKARNMIVVIKRITEDKNAEKAAAENYDYDKLDLFAIIELSHYRDMTEKIEQFSEKSENLIDVAIDYMSCGLSEDALYALSFDRENSPMIHYYRSYIQSQLGLTYSVELRTANSLDTGICFPSRSEDIKILSFAKEKSNNTNRNYKNPNPHYYLGCLYYNFERYKDARFEFEKAVEIDPHHAKSLRNLSLLLFDHFEDKENCTEYMKTAFENKRDPRLFMEYQQLLKNVNTEPEIRKRLYYENEDMLKERDDCLIDLITLECLTGNYEKAISLAKNKRFHIYEGGEGRLTKLHGWMFLLEGLKCLKENKIDDAEKYMKSALEVPKYYGEAKTFFNQEAHIYYFLGKIAELKGNDPTECYEKASEYKAAVSEISAFRALALKKLGKSEKAKEVSDEMHESGKKLLSNCDLRSYYGVGSPSPMPFENDIIKKNLTDGHVLLCYSYLAKGYFQKADNEIKKVIESDKNDFRAYVYPIIKEFIC